ncbi:hypothetical protein [Nitrosomonas sp.]|uniref:hypothetical protein n=1 Tax=Nitrosomonas sp. TaxID=42353 RepID=UPI00262C6118|nr:hypothetical protein [Nitrosomonas sp.]MCW5600627.1 hypothetical protein [Nitrosomonas sp.]
MKMMIRGCSLVIISLLSTQAVWADSVEFVHVSHFAEIATLEELDNARGREGIDMNVFNNMDMNAVLTGNTATNNVTGVNIIDNGSFAGAMGMFSVIQNSGNNVIIQDSTIVNVTVIP